MTFDTAMAARIITDEVNAAAAGGTEAATMAAKPSDFCGIWRAAKPILESISKLIVLFPGLGGSAGAVLAGLNKVGDMI